jgi:hypothetical protein
MARGVATFKQSDLTRALKAAKDAGVDLHITITKDGSFQIETDVTADTNEPVENGRGSASRHRVKRRAPGASLFLRVSTPQSRKSAIVKRRYASSAPLSPRSPRISSRPDWARRGRARRSRGTFFAI